MFIFPAYFSYKIHPLNAKNIERKRCAIESTRLKIDAGKKQ